MLLTKVGDETGKGNVEGEQVITESYIFLVKDDLEFGEWDFAEFKRDKLKKWTRAGYVFEGECAPGPPLPKATPPPGLTSAGLEA